MPIVMIRRHGSVAAALCAGQRYAVLNGRLGARMDGGDRFLKPRALQGAPTKLLNAVRAISAIRSSCALAGNEESAIKTTIAR